MPKPLKRSSERALRPQFSPTNSGEEAFFPGERSTRTPCSKQLLPFSGGMEWPNRLKLPTNSGEDPNKERSEIGRHNDNERECISPGHDQRAGNGPGSAERAN